MMGDAGEGLIDQDARIQERMEELERERTNKAARGLRDPARVRTLEALESLKLARTELQRQHDATTHVARRAQITQALTELDRRITETTAALA
jgi:hypothetical protein